MYGVLVVDDDEGVRMALTRLLRKAGYRIYTAESGGEALTCLQRHSDAIHAVTLDLVMPGMHGLDVVKHLANDHRTAVGIVVVSGWPSFENVRRFFESGSEYVLTRHFLQKPIDDAQLIAEIGETVNAVLKKREALARAADEGLYSRLDAIERRLASQPGFLAQLGLDLVRAVIVAAALLLMLLFGLDDFVRQLLGRD